MNKNIESEFRIITTFRIELKNGRTFEFSGYSMPNEDMKLIGDHLVITIMGKFRAAFALSEIVFAALTPMYLHESGLYMVTPAELEVLKRHQSSLEMVENNFDAYRQSNSRKT